jgi:hypothetical protein
MTRVQRYHQRHDRLAIALATLGTIACAALDAAVIYAWWVS